MSDRLFSDAIRQRLEGAPRKLRIGICFDERRPIGPLLAEQSSSTAIEPVPVMVVGEQVSSEPHVIETAPPPPPEIALLVAAVMFPCSGRGRGLYGRPDGDLSVLREASGQNSNLSYMKMAAGTTALFE